MKVQRITVLTYDDVDAEREGTKVVVGLAEYLDYARKFDKPPLGLYEEGGDFEGWAYTAWSRLRRLGTEGVPEKFEDWLVNVAEALPAVMAKAFESAEREIEAGGETAAPDPSRVAAAVTDAAAQEAAAATTPTDRTTTPTD